MLSLSTTLSLSTMLSLYTNYTFLLFYTILANLMILMIMSLRFNRFVGYLQPTAFGLPFHCQTRSEVHGEEADWHSSCEK